MLCLSAYFGDLKLDSLLRIIYGAIQMCSWCMANEPLLQYSIVPDNRIAVNICVRPLSPLVPVIE